MIQASILRASDPAELDYRHDLELSAEATRFVRRVLESSARPRGEAAAEFLMALCTGRLRLHDDHLEELLTPTDDMPPFVKGLLELCRTRLIKETETITDGTGVIAAARRTVGKFLVRAGEKVEGKRKRGSNL